MTSTIPGPTTRPRMIRREVVFSTETVDPTLPAPIARPPMRTSIPPTRETSVTGSPRLSAPSPPMSSGSSTAPAGIDVAKVNAIRASLAEGSYKVDPQAIADRMLSLENALSK